MAQWTLKYTTVEDPSNYITITGNVNGNFYYDIPYNIANGNIPNLYNVDITGINSSRVVFYSNSDLNYGYDFSSTFGTLYYLDELSNTSKITNMSRMFYNCCNLTSIPNFDTSNVINVGSMFSQCYNLTTVPNLNTSSVTDMSNMFYFCYNLTTIPNFNISNVINMSSMFSQCKNLTDVPNFNTSNVTDMSYMFGFCKNLISIPNFNTSNVKDMSWMFYFCYNLTTIPNLNTSNITDMSWMFDGCYNLTTVPSFNTTNITNMIDTFNACYNLSNLSLKNIAKSLPNVSQLTSQNSNLRNIGLSQNQINYISTTKYASQLQARGWNIEDNYIKPDLVKSLKMKQSDGTMNLAMLGTDAEYVDMEDGTTLEETVQNLKQYIDDNVANILGGMY